MSYNRTFSLDLGNEIDPHSVDARLDGVPFVMDSRQELETEMVEDAQAVREYINVNVEPGESRVFHSNGQLRRPIDDGPFSGAFAFAKKMPKPVRAFNNWLVEAAHSIWEAFKGAIGTVVNAFRRDRGPEVSRVQLHENSDTKENGLRITETENGFEAETVEDGKVKRATFAADTRPGDLCKAIIVGAESTIPSDLQDLREDMIEAAEKAPSVESPNEEVSTADPNEGPMVERDGMADGEEVPLSVYEQMDEEISEPTEFDSADYSDFNGDIEESDEAAPEPEAVMPHLLPKVVQESAITLMLEDEPGKSIENEAVETVAQEDHQPFKLTEDEEQLRTEGVPALTAIPTLSDPLAFNLNEVAINDQFNVGELIENAAEEQIRLPEKSELEAIYVGLNQTPQVFVNSEGETHMIGNPPEDMLILAEIAEIEGVEPKLQRDEKGMMVVSAICVDGEEVALAKVKEDLHRQEEVVYGAVKEALMKVAAEKQAEDKYTAPELPQNQPENVPEKQDLEGIFYKNRVPGDDRPEM